MAFKDSRLNQTTIIIPLDSLLSESHHTPLFSEAGGLCLHQPAIFKQISLYVIRGEFKFPRAAAVVALGLQCRITTRPTRNQESFNMAT